MSPKAKEYIISERFIHDALAGRAYRAYQRACSLWRQDGAITPTALIWPSDTVMTSGGEGHDGVVVAALPDGQEKSWFLAEALKRLQPYGILVIETIESLGRVAIEGIFETAHGARCWSCIGRRHGDVWMLGSEVVLDNHHHLGILWRQDRGTA